MSKLYIIGNGFDLKHQLPTRYSDFAYFCKALYPCLFWKMSVLFPKISVGSLWSNFENGLGLPDEEHLNQLAEIYTKKGDDLSSSLNFDLKDALKEWVICLKKMTGTLKPIYNFDEDAMFITFNYTDTLEKLYKIKPSNIIHIHDFAKDKDEEQLFAGYIFGHDRNLEQTSSENFVNTFKKEKKDENLLEKLNEWSLNNPIDIFVLGHSINNIDLSYFKIIANKFENAIWHFDYLNEDDKNTKLKSLSHIENVNNVIPIDETTK